EKGKLVYSVENESPGIPEGWHTLRTQNGESFQLKLPDGSEVWLNSGTTITYPTNFDKRYSRVVKLHGEAYFDVAHNQAKPFQVNTVGQIVEVLGTEFNVNTYSVGSGFGSTSKGKVVTTLVEGSVRILPEGLASSISEASVVLKPGEQAISVN